jgi:hypothetical protein
MAQTALQWFIEKAFDEKFLWVTDKPEMVELNSIIEQAKQIDKEQKIEFAKQCLNKALDTDIRTAYKNVEQYYNETYGTTDRS